MVRICNKYMASLIVRIECCRRNTRPDFILQALISNAKNSLVYGIAIANAYYSMRCTLCTTTSLFANNAIKHASWLYYGLVLSHATMQAKTNKNQQTLQIFSFQLRFVMVIETLSLLVRFAA